MKSIFNQFIGYVDRSIKQQKDAILGKINSPTGIPEMTDHTDSNPWIKTINVWTGISELWHYYIDNAAQEVFVPVAKEFKSLAYFAEAVDYRIKGRLSASVDQTFYISSPTTDDIVIPIGTRVKTKSGIFFTITEEKTIVVGETQVVCKARNEASILNSVIGTSNGQASQKFPIVNNVLDGSISLVINGVTWFPKETLGFSGPTDFHFVAGLNENGLMTVCFGNGITGAIPENGFDIVANYITTDGINANLPPSTISIIDSTITVPTGVILQTLNADSSSGGSNEENIEALRKNIPLSLRTLYRAVTKDDYKSIIELVPGVSKCLPEYNGGRTVDLYLAPTGSTTGIASTLLLDTAEEFIDDKKIITTRVRAKSAGVVKIKIVADLFIGPNYVNSTKETEAKNILAEYLSIENQNIKGSVELGDIFQKLENIEGALYAGENLRMTPVPYARPLDNELQLIWTRSIKPASNSTIHWKLIKSASGAFQLLKNGSYIGTFNFGDDLSFTELDMNVSNGSYVVGNSWEFVTYKYKGSIQLDEPCIPVSDLSDITINVTGGI